MLWFLLTALAYASALAGVVGAVGFVAVQRYALLQRLLAAGVDRVLVRLVDPEGGHSVTHTDAGGRPPGPAAALLRPLACWHSAAAAAGCILLPCSPCSICPLPFQDVQLPLPHLTLVACRRRCRCQLLRPSLSQTFPFPPLSVTAGVLVTDLHVRASVLQQTEYSGSRVTAASVARLELEFPSLSLPLTLRVAGVSLAVQQVRLPKVRSQCAGVYETV